MDKTNLIFLLIYFLVIILLTTFIKKPKDIKEYLSGNQNLGYISMALSISATWIWAPALFVSAEKSYINGYAGLMWFVLPNILCLLLFIPFAIKIRKQNPDGYTLSNYIGRRYDKKVKGIYITQLSLLAVLSTVVQLVAGGKIISLMTGIPFVYTSIILGGVALLYSLNKGIKASIFTDAVQMIMILAVVFLLVPLLIKNNGVEPIFNGLNGVNNDTTFFNDKGWQLFLAFGIPTTIGLIAGPFGDQNFYQRIFSVKEDKIKHSMVLASIFFAIVPIGMGLIGFMASGIGFRVSDTSIVNFELVEAVLPASMSIVFMFILLSGLLSTIDSNLNSFSALSNDVIKNADMRTLKYAMVLLTVVSLVLSNIDLGIVDLFLIYGILRATTFGTTIATLLGVKLNSNGVFYGVLVALVIGVPTFVIGKMTDNLTLTIFASIFTLVISFLIAYIYTKIKGVVINANN